MLLRCIDFETTGLPTDEDPHAVCEAGWCDVEGDDGRPWRHGAPSSSLINPNRPITPQSAGVCWITDDMVRDAPPATTIFAKIANAFTPSGRPDYWVAHNVKMEKTYFAGYDAPWICTYRAALRLWPDAPDHKQGTLAHYLKLPLDRALATPPHRAGPDAYVCAAIMRHILAETDVSFDDLVKWSKGAPLMPRFPIGEHYGKPWSEVPDSYLDWMVRKGSFGDDIMANVRHHLKQRRTAAR